jgi:exopolyphosphatase/guanosine-5'-triphosphate,3'-diphosphate pyrophosphatase
MKNGLFGVINIGASAFRMQISEFVNGEQRLIEYLIKSLPLGKDTFTKGYITLETVKKSADILGGFQNKMSEYKVEKYVAVATSGLRDAVNKDFFIDYIFKKTGIQLNVLDPYEELYIRFTSLMNEIENFSDVEKGGFLFANVSSGNVAIVVSFQKSIIYSEALPFGSLRLNEIFRDVDERGKVIAFRNYVDNMLAEVKRIIGKVNIKFVYFTGSTVDIIRFFFKESSTEFNINDVRHLLEKIEGLSSEEIVENYGLRRSQADILKAVLVTYSKIMKITGKNKFYITPTTFPHKLLMYFSKSYRKKSYGKYIENSLLYYGKKFEFDKNHALKVKENVRKIFNELKDIHNLPNSYLRLLEIAAITHDFGYFINPSNHEYNSYQILKSLHLPGVFERDMEVVSLVVLLHREVEVDDYKEYFPPDVDIFLIKKLVAMFRVADSLDSGHKQKIADFIVKKETDIVKVVARTVDYIFLERLSFEKKSKLFENVFGVKIELEEDPIK